MWSRLSILRKVGARTHKLIKETNKKVITAIFFEKNCCKFGRLGKGIGSVKGKLIYLTTMETHDSTSLDGC